MAVIQRNEIMKIKKKSVSCISLYVWELVTLPRMLLSKVKL